MTLLLVSRSPPPLLSRPLELELGGETSKLNANGFLNWFPFLFFQIYTFLRI